MEHEKQDIERIKELCLLDDEFFQVCMQDNIEAVQLILRLVLRDESLVVRAVTTQKEMKNLLGHSLCLDVYAVSSTGERLDVEIQRATSGASPERAEYHSSMLDANSLSKGRDFRQKAVTYTIFITEKDIFGAGEALYPVERMVQVGDVWRPFGGKAHILYVNSAYVDAEGSQLSRLMHDLRCKEPREMFFEELAQKAGYFKYESKGVRAMAGVLDELRRESEEKGEAKGMVKVALKMLSSGEPMEKIALFTSLSMQEIKRLSTSPA